MIINVSININKALCDDCFKMKEILKRLTYNDFSRKQKIQPINTLTNVNYEGQDQIYLIKHHATLIISNICL